MLSVFTKSGITQVFRNEGRLSVAFSTARFAHQRRSNSAEGPTLRQKRIAAEVMKAVSQGLQEDSCRNSTLQRCGFQLQDVEMSADLRRAFIRWRSLPGMQKTAEIELQKHAMRLRSFVFSRLSMSFSPLLKFEEDQRSARVQELEDALNKLKEDEVNDKQQN